MLRYRDNPILGWLYSCDVVCWLESIHTCIEGALALIVIVTGPILRLVAVTVLDVINVPGWIRPRRTRRCWGIEVGAVIFW
jgi:hypothetical protein